MTRRVTAVPIVWGQPTDERLHDLATSAAAFPFSYPEVGMTSAPAPPAGYQVLRRRAALGSGLGVFDRAAAGLRTWAAHRQAGLRVAPSTAPVAEGAVVVVALSMGPLTVVAPCRIVSVTDESTAFGFTYGTLLSHPERGEESFTVVQDGDDVHFEIVAYSRPAHLLARLGGPVGRRLQARVTDRYVRGLQQHAATK